MAGGRFSAGTKPPVLLAALAAPTSAGSQGGERPPSSSAGGAAAPPPPPPWLCGPPSGLGRWPWFTQLRKLEPVGAQSGSLWLFISCNITAEGSLHRGWQGWLLNRPCFPGAAPRRPYPPRLLPRGSEAPSSRRSWVLPPQPRSGGTCTLTPCRAHRTGLCTLAVCLRVRWGPGKRGAAL